MTVTIKHHLDDALLLAYSTGNLPEAFSLTVAAHISMCDECRARLGAFDTVGGALIDESDVAALADDSFEATLARIGDMDNGVAARPASVVKKKSALPAPLHDYVGGDIDAINWKPVGLGVKQAILPTEKDATARLLFIPAGVAVPDHGHHGTELTLVLKGAYSDEHDRFSRGDIEIANEEMDHTPVADIGEDCICLTAADARLKFRSFLPRLAQPFFRI
ncbi:MAG: ChrR family anti-sigma-E factor [Pseudomonadota bacterium]